MDPVDDIREELECGICMELYREPKTLPCIHSFCRICLIRHILSQKTLHERTKCFLCPLCRLQVYVPRPKDPIETWANQLPNNTSIPAIISRLENSRKTSCVFHPTESVSSFCKSCNILACGNCLQERHPTCTGDAFCTIREMGLKRKTDLQTCIKDLDSEVHRICDDFELMKSVISGLIDAENTIVEQVHDQTNLSIKSIQEAETQLLLKLDNSVKEQLDELKRAKQPMDESADILQRYRTDVSNLMDSCTGLNFLDNLEVMAERRKETCEKIQEIQNQCVAPDVIFVESETLSPSIGKLVPCSDSTGALLENVASADGQLQYTSMSMSLGQIQPNSVKSRKESPLLTYLNAVGSPVTAKKRNSLSETYTQAL